MCWPRVGGASRQVTGVPESLMGLAMSLAGLPPDLLYGTGIPARIPVIAKENAGAHAGIFMLDAIRGFGKGGNKNRLRAPDIHPIVDVFRRVVHRP